MRYSDPRELDTDIIRTDEREEPAIYFLLNRYKNPIYVGHSKRLRHRLQAIVYGRADYDQLKNKKQLREEAEYYKRAYTGLERARKIERRKKESMKFNEG